MVLLRMNQGSTENRVKFNFKENIIIIIPVIIIISLIIALFVFRPEKIIDIPPPAVRERVDITTESGKLLINGDKELRNISILYEQGYIEEAKDRLNHYIIDVEDKKLKIKALIALSGIYIEQGRYKKALELNNIAHSLSRKNSFIYYNRAMIFLNLKETGAEDKAIEFFKKSLLYKPKIPYAYYELANIYYNRKQYDKAKSYYQKSFKLDKKNRKAQYNYAITLFYLDKQKDSVKILKKLIKSEPDDVAASAAFQLGNIEVHNKKYSKSIEYYNRAIQISPEFTDALYNLGIMYYTGKQTRKAVDIFERLVSLENNNIEILNKLADIYYRSGNIDTSFKYLEMLLRANPRNINALSLLGDIYYSRGEYEEAALRYLKIIELSPTSSESKIAYINLGNVYFKFKLYKKAIQNYEKALQLDKESDNIYINLGLAYNAIGNFNKALTLFQTAVNLNPDNYNAHIYLAQAYEKLGHREDARNIYNDAIDLFPESYEAYFYLGNNYYALSKFEKAKQVYIKLLELNPPDDIRLKVNLSLANIYDELKDYNKAIEFAKKVLTFDSKNVTGNYNMGIIYFNKGDIEMAMEYLLRIIHLNPSDEVLANTYYVLGNCYFKRENYGLAIKQYEESIQLKPDFTEAFYNLKIAQEKESERVNKNQ